MPLQPGTRLGPYEVVSALGAGGMGEVYRARDTRLGRDVAVKVLPAGLSADTERLQRFEQEARAAAALNHPNILALYDIGTHDGAPYLVTELLEGATLCEQLSAGPLPVRKAVEYAGQIAHGLAAVHEKGIVHRDLKPENLFVTKDGRVKILDFGLAKLTRPETGSGPLTEAPTVTAGTEPGVILGTVGYMSPEHVRGLPADNRSDIFTFGTILYEMVSGRRAFRGDSAVETMSAILKEEPPELSKSSQDVSPGLQRVVRRCLEKSPEERFQSARDLAFDLKEILTGSDISRPSPWTEHGRKPQPRPRKAIDSLAVLPLVNASDDPNAEYLSDGITESIINNLSKLPRLRVMARSTVFRYKDRDVDAQTVGAELNVRAVLTGRVLQRGDRLTIRAELVDVADGSQLWGDQYNRKLSDIFALEKEIAKHISENLQLKLSGEEKRRLSKRDTVSLEAYQAYLKGRYYWSKRAEEGFKKGIEYFNEAIEKDPNYALAYTGLADSYSVLGDYGFLPPKEAFPKAKAAATKALEIDNTLAEAHTSLAYTLWAYDWNWAESEKEYKRGIKRNPGRAEAHQWYAEYLVAMGRLDEALAETKRAQELDPLTLIVTAVVGWVFYFARRYDEAIEQFRKTLDMDPNFARARIYVGRAYVQKSLFEQAIAEFQEGTNLSGGSPTYLAELGHACAVGGKRIEALKILDELKELSERRYVSPYDMGLLYTGLGEKDLAFDWLEKAYEGRSFYLVFLNVEPRLDSLRSDPRFADLLRRVGPPLACQP